MLNNQKERVIPSEKLGDAKQATNNERLEIKDLNGCEVIFEENEIIPKPGDNSKEDELAKMLRGVINSPKLLIRKADQPLSGKGFRTWREKLIEDPEFIENPKYEKI